MTVMNTTVRFLRSAVPAHRRRSAILFAGAVVAVASAGSATGLFTTRGGLAAARMADAAPRPHAIEEAPADRAITEPFTRFALNALLVPLLDEQPRPHWTDAGMRFFCGPDTHVDVDGAPLVPGAPVPVGAFTVRWRIDRCWPLNVAAFELSGDVELRVLHEDARLTAVVSAQRLNVAAAKGTGRVGAPFAASMALDRRADQ